MLGFPIPDELFSRQDSVPACAKLSTATRREETLPFSLHRAFSKLSQCVLAQYGWLCLCHVMDLESSRLERIHLSPSVFSILITMATVVFTAVGHKKHFELLTQHVLPSRSPCTPIYANNLLQR